MLAVTLFGFVSGIKTCRQQKEKNACLNCWDASLCERRVSHDLIFGHPTPSFLPIVKGNQVHVKLTGPLNVAHQTTGSSCAPYHSDMFTHDLVIVDDQQETKWRWMAKTR